MKQFAAAILAATAFGQFDPTDCCRSMPIDPRCMGCGPENDVSSNGMSASDVNTLIAGVLAGAKIQSVDDLGACITDTNITAHIDAAADDFDDGSPNRMNDGIKELG